ncbi:beta-ketoacyl-[acyl-carrier-protein] synthase family protein [Saccharopolyspora elongata]|uniref:3-oxoacyl-[acyl-carrier-protein] synthase 2 n=1 Tax=Saccharopolyspora elongata TaxID=2530387 RepID=A0A4R4Y0J7_9PSEU|nr:beta-ketoacyl-[acyl-carrier-protein] synthase family protein [Saccharopolyspora elongata]TDD37741.1 beta-ketoacyl-[acyl-carrier-protein] synthase family protein [Saccharopolyspora elongata]
MSGFAVAVTGLGLITPAGIGVKENWNRVAEGHPTAATDLELAGLQVDFSCRVPGFDPAASLGKHNAWRLDRHQQFALVAAREAVRDAGLSEENWDVTRVGVVLGTGAGGTSTMEAQQTKLLDSGAAKVSAMTLPMGLLNMAAGQLAIELGVRGPNLTICTACASGTSAIGVARDLIRSGAADIVIAGATEAAVTPLFVAAFSRMRALSRKSHDPRSASRPFDAMRDGFVIAEGAAVLILESERHALARGARVRGRVIGYGASADGHHVTAPDPEGNGAEQALRSALTDAGLTAREVQHVNAHGTSTPLNDVAEAATIRRVLGDHVAVSSTKGVTGHALGAGGAIEAAYGILSLQHGCIPPTANLENPDPQIELDLVSKTARPCALEVVMSNSFGFGGQNAVLALAAS